MDRMDEANAQGKPRTATDDPWRLERFVSAQDQGGTYERALAELRAGAKRSHWMWFVFPQIAGLGLSAVSREYAISSAGEARAYLAHPVLGPRLRECAQIVADTEDRSAERIFGSVDALKLRSSVTLFAAAGGEDGGAVFRAVLARYFGGVPDEATVARLLAGRRQPGLALAAPGRGGGDPGGPVEGVGAGSAAIAPRSHRPAEPPRRKAFATLGGRYAGRHGDWTAGRG